MLLLKNVMRGYCSHHQKHYPTFYVQSKEIFYILKSTTYQRMFHVKSILDNAVMMKAAERERIAKDVEKFLKNGGKIEQRSPSDTTAIRCIGAWQKK